MAQTRYILAAGLVSTDLRCWVGCPECASHTALSAPCTHASRRVDLFRPRDQPPSAHARQRRRTRPAASVQIQQREPSGKRMQTHLTRHAACDGHRNGHLFIVRCAVHAPYSPRRLCSHPPTRSGRSLLLEPRRSRASPRRTFHNNVPAQTFSKSGGAKTDAPKCNSNCTLLGLQRDFRITHLSVSQFVFTPAGPPPSAGRAHDDACLPTHLPTAVVAQVDAGRGMPPSRRAINGLPPCSRQAV